MTKALNFNPEFEKKRYVTMKYTQILGLTEKGIYLLTSWGPMWFPRKYTILDTKNNLLVMPLWLAVKKAIDNKTAPVDLATYESYTHEPLKVPQQKKNWRAKHNQKLS